MQKVVLKAEPRAPGRHMNRELRLSDRVPGVVYGRTIEAQPVSLDRRSLGQALHEAAGGVIEMQLPGRAKLHVLTREIQRDPIKHNIKHIDFYAVSMTQLVRVQVPVVPEGVAPVLEDSSMVLVRSTDSVEIECLPANIPEHLVADLSKLVSVEDSILVSDLALPPNTKLITDGDHVVFAITISRAGAIEEETEAIEEAETAASEVEVVTKRKPKEEEAGED